jgi:MinD-like ATPase involved in chromosome partitioning or flagellar assembly
VIDTDIQSPGIHVLFGLTADSITHSLNDYLRGRCAIAEASHDVTARLTPPPSGRVMLIPSRLSRSQISNVGIKGRPAGCSMIQCEHKEDA